LLPIAGSVLEDEGHAALDAVDQRIIALLRIKQESGCAAVPSGLAPMTDLDILEKLSGLMPDKARKLSHQEMLDSYSEITRALDHLVGPWQPGGSGSAAGHAD
jgi:hypothetical protein